jgi:hypothetical protein
MQYGRSPHRYTAGEVPEFAASLRLGTRAGDVQAPREDAQCEAESQKPTHLDELQSDRCSAAVADDDDANKSESCAG